MNHSNPINMAIVYVLADYFDANEFKNNPHINVLQNFPPNKLPLQKRAIDFLVGLIPGQIAKNLGNQFNFIVKCVSVGGEKVTDQMMDTAFKRINDDIAQKARSNSNNNFNLRYYITCPFVYENHTVLPQAIALLNHSTVSVYLAAGDEKIQINKVNFFSNQANHVPRNVHVCSTPSANTGSVVNFVADTCKSSGTSALAKMCLDIATHFKSQ